MFGNLQNSWTAGFSHLTDFNETLQKIKQDLELNIESSLGIEGRTGAPRTNASGSELDPAEIEGNNKDYTQATSGILTEQDVGEKLPAEVERQVQHSVASDPSLQTPVPIQLHPDGSAVAFSPVEEGEEQQILLPFAGLASTEAEAATTDAGDLVDGALPLSVPSGRDPNLADAAASSDDSNAFVPDDGLRHTAETAPAPADKGSQELTVHQTPLIAPLVPLDTTMSTSLEGPLAAAGDELDQGSSAQPLAQQIPREDTASPPIPLISPQEVDVQPLQPVPSLVEPYASDIAEVPLDSSLKAGPLSNGPNTPSELLPSVEISGKVVTENGNIEAFSLSNLEIANGDQEDIVRADHALEGGTRVVDQSQESPVESSASKPDNAVEPGAPEVTDAPQQAAEIAIADEVDLSDAEAVRKLVTHLRKTVSARESQLESKSQEQARLEDVTHQLMAHNEELARKSAAISEEDLEAMRAEFKARLETAERKVYALSKERDALRRGSDKLSSANDLLKEKDAIIQQVMEEGERLSKKQLAQENTIKKLRAQIKEADLAKVDVSTNLTIERQKVEAAQSARSKAEADLLTANQAHKAELEAEKAHYSGLLQKARSAQTEAEQRAAASAKEGLQRKLREAEARVESLADTVEELRSGLARQRAASDLREDMLQREVADLQRRNESAEARHEELAAALPEATRPLLRQLEAMQAAQQQHATAWAAAEASLTQRAHDAEARAAGAGERERLASERLQAATARAASAAASLEAARSEASSTGDELERECQLRREADAKLRRAELALVQAREEAAEAARTNAEAAKEAEEALEAQRMRHLDAQLAAEQRAAAAEERLRSGSQASSSSGPTPTPAPGPNAAGGPPAMAGPGYKWVLLKEDEQPPAPRPQGNPTPSAGAPPTSRVGMAGELERLRDTIRAREDQLSSMQSQLAGLEATRDSLAEELLKASHAAEAGQDQQRQLDRLRAQHQEGQSRLAAAVELLGEREERLAELSADLADVKTLYKDQIEFMVEQLVIAQTPPASPAVSGSLTSEDLKARG